MALEPNDRAPGFSLPDGSRTQLSLSDYSGQTVVLVFYLKAFTNGCRNQLLRFRELHQQFTKANAVVIAISTDTFLAAGEFARRLMLPYPVLSDFPARAASTAYGVFDSETGSTLRATFVIDSAGRVRERILSDDDMALHAEAALAAVQQIARQQ